MSIQEYESKYNKSWRMWVDFLNPTDEDIIPLMFNYYEPNTPYYKIDFTNQDELDYWKDNYDKIYEKKFRDYIHYYVLIYSSIKKINQVIEIKKNHFEKMTTDEKIEALFGANS